MASASTSPDFSGWRTRLVFFLSSQTLSLFGSSLVQYAILWHITLEARSGLVQTISILAGFLPQFLLSPFAGVWADRYDRRRLMVLADAGIALVTLGLALMWQAGLQELWLLFLAQGLRSLGAAVQMPAVSAFVPQLVPPDQLTRVSGIQQSIQSATMLASPVAAAGLMSFAPLQTIFYVDVVTAVLAIAVLWLGVRVPAHERAQAPSGTSYFHDLKEGLSYIRSHSYVARCFLYCAVFLFMAAPAAFLTPLQVARSFGPEVWRLTAIEIAFFSGMMGAGVGIATWGGFPNRMVTMIFATALFGVTTVGMGLVPWFWAYLVVMALCGVGIPLFNTPSTVLLQEQVESEFLGRVFGVMGMLGSVMMPMGMLLFGPLADVVRIEVLLIASGCVMGVLAVVMALDRSMVAHGVPKASTATTAGQTSESKESSTILDSQVA